MRLMFEKSLLASRREKERPKAFLLPKTFEGG